ncbi:hypothetical protein [Salinarimonas chemoclinalis]|uniref:hypothetical protein n=1 Tax=Salinarimonas chemoclinalis TaxID=3241599 RepID=UPI00355718DD
MQERSGRYPEADAAATLEAALAAVRALSGELADRRIAAARRTLAGIHVRAAMARRGGPARRP